MKRAILESATNTGSNDMAENPRKQSMIAGTLVEERALKEPATPAPVVEQPFSVLHENRPEEFRGPTVSISDQLRPGKVFALFELQRELANGSTGAVWLAEDLVRRQADQVALKFLPDSIVTDKTAVAELKDEIRRRIALQHANILRVYDLLESKGRVAIQMEYLDGQSLSRLRLSRPNQIFEVRDLEKWVTALCEALEYAHKDIGLIDGDIVPGNLIVDLAGNLKLDFGITNCITDSMSRLMIIHHTSETLPYKSPQRAAGGEPAITDDLYSLGATLYELLTSKPPFYAGDIDAQVSGKVPPSMTERRAQLGIAGEAIPNNWEETVAACLAKDPVQRPQSAIEVEKRLKSATSSVAKPQPAVRTPLPRKPWLVIAGIIFILSFGSALAFFAFRHLTEPKLGKIVLNTIPAKANVFLDGVPAKGPSATPTFPPAPAGFTGKESALSVVAPFPEVSPTPFPEVSPTPSSEVSLTPSSEVSPTPSSEVSPTPSSEVSPTPSSEVSPTPSSQEIAVPNETGPSATPLSQRDIDPTNEDVVKRISALPGVNAEKKANLIEKMHKAHSMERLTVIPFDRGQTTLHRGAADELVKAFARPEMRDRLSDPTTILVVAGYADIGGRADLNLRISQERAENVSRILKEQAKLLNATQTIGMGGTELLDSKRPDQNRAVEVWAVVPL
jgi:serine/threonine protein kinase